MAPNFYALHERLAKVPLGGEVSSRLLRVAAPYFLTIPASITSLEPGRGTARMLHAPWVRNHLGTVHAISLCNLAEFTMGAVAEATVPATHRWVPKGMTVAYPAMARGTMHAEVTIALPDPLPDKADVQAVLSIVDGEGTETLSGAIDLWVTRRR